MRGSWASLLAIIVGILALSMPVTDAGGKARSKQGTEGRQQKACHLADSRRFWVPGSACGSSAEPKSCYFGINTSLEWSTKCACKPGRAMKSWQRRNSNKTVAHLVVVDHQKNKTLNWRSSHELSIIRHSVKYVGQYLEVNRKGLYYVYCQVGFRGNVANVKLSNQILTWHDSNPEPSVLLAGTESVVGPPVGSLVWYATLSQGGLAELEDGHRLYVTVSHPEFVDYMDGKTFFGLVMVS